MRVGKLSGAVGTYSAADPEVERIACERLGLEPAPSSTQILQRDRHAEFLNALALIAASLERFALEIRHLARTEVREVEEPFASGQKGSSAMPHKRNPSCPSASAGSRASCGRSARQGSRTSRSGTSATSPTRRPSGSCCPTRSSRSTTCSTASPGSWKASSSAERMRENLDASHRLYFSQRLLLALVEAACRGTTRTGSCSVTRCAHGTRGSTSASSSARDTEVAGRVDSTPSSTRRVHAPRRRGLRAAAARRREEHVHA